LRVRLFAGLRLFCLSLTDSRRAAIRSMTRPPLPAQPDLLDLEAADDLVGIDALAGVLGHLVVANRRQVVLVKKVEPQLLRLGGRPDYMRTGTLTRPNEMVPLLIGRIASYLPSPAAEETRKPMFQDWQAGHIEPRNRANTS